MVQQLSPGIAISEIDITTTVPSVSTSAAALAGIFSWGPVGERTLISSETQLTNVFGKPNANNYQTWFTAKEFLDYSNKEFIVRAANTTTTNNLISAHNAFGNIAVVSNVFTQTILNSSDYDLKVASGVIDTNALWIAKYPGALGNSLMVSVCDSVNAYSSNLYANGLASPLALGISTSITVPIGSNTATWTAVANTSLAVTDANTYLSTVLNSLTVGDYLYVGNTVIGNQYLQVATIGATTSNSTVVSAPITFTKPYVLSTDFVSNTTTNSVLPRFWQYFNSVGIAPTQSQYNKNYGNTTAVDSLHVVVVDQGGAFGPANSVLETFTNVSRATDATGLSGASLYYKNVINSGSRYVWFGNDRIGATSNTSLNIASSTNTKPATMSFTAGSDGYTESTTSLATIANGYDLFAKPELVDVSLILQGKPIGGSTVVNGQTVSNFQLANYIIDNIVLTRKDCLAVISPDDNLIVSNYNNEAVSLVNWRGALRDTSYAVLDSGYKYTYDKYSDVYRWVPQNGDVAGLMARTDQTNDAWWSPAGFNRGQIKNVVKLRWNPNQADRDLIYPNGINPIVTFPGRGTVLFGDKTLKATASAFDRINVRRLFIVLEKAISKMAVNYLFEFNDEFTQSQFKNTINPYLRDIQGRRGITEYLVVCDSSNNTPQRIQNNEFWGSIYVKPNYAINFIQLQFVAVGPTIEFSTVVGKF